jgi:hypothetical protein
MTYAIFIKPGIPAYTRPLLSEKDNAFVFAGTCTEWPTPYLEWLEEQGVEWYLQPGFMGW